MISRLSVTAPFDRRGRRREAGYTMAEMLMAMGIGGTVIAGAMAFVLFGATSTSGIINQTRINQQAGNAIEFIQSRVRLATLVSNDASGNVLTLGFDSNFTVDSGNGGNGVAWANTDYYGQFKFAGVNTTNLHLSAGKNLIWIPNINNTNNFKVLIGTGVRNLPGHVIFSVTNSALVTICFGVVDTNPRDYYEAIEIQAMAASLNRLPSQNMVSILPAP
jgi:Tfp pilus assembly protein PilW